MIIQAMRRATGDGDGDFSVRVVLRSVRVADDARWRDDRDLGVMIGDAGAGARGAHLRLVVGDAATVAAPAPGPPDSA
jgi:hypothetical protein